MSTDRFKLLRNRNFCQQLFKPEFLNLLTVILYLRTPCLSDITNFYKPSDSPFLGQVRQVLRLRHMSRSTEKGSPKKENMVVFQTCWKANKNCNVEKIAGLVLPFLLDSLIQQV